MGVVAAMMGILYIFWSVLLPKLSDNFGRKTIATPGYILCLVTPMAMFLFAGQPGSAWLYVIFGGVLPGICPLQMNIIPLESIPVHLRGTAGGVIQGLGDFIGGACWPLLAGMIADRSGLPSMMLYAAIIVLIGIVLSFFLIESHPNKSKLPYTLET